MLLSKEFLYYLIYLNQIAPCIRFIQFRVFVGPMYFKDNLRTIEAQFPKKLRTTEAHFEFTGPYKKKKACIRPC